MRKLFTGLALAASLSLGACLTGPDANTSVVSQGARYEGPQKWGGLDRLAGRTYSYTDWNYGTSYSRSFEWEAPGEKLLARYDIAGSTGTIPYTIDPATGVVAGYELHSDGSLATKPVDVEGRPTRTRMRAIGSDVYQETIEQYNGSSWNVMLMGTTNYTSTQARAQADAENAAFWNGMATGALAVAQAYAGASTEGSVSSGMSGAGGGAGSTVPGSYIERRNFLEESGICESVGVSMGDYRSSALSGGRDVQLKTMCGQAYEYYSMYLRAIAQGYSESEANRTYDAYSASATTAVNFRRDASAN